MSKDFFQLVGIAFLVGLFLWLFRRRNTSLKLPPSFNFTPLDERAPYEIYRDWSESCGSALIHLTLHHKEVIIVNKASVARDLLESRWYNYSDRPQFHMMNLIGRENNVVVQNYGPRLKIARRLIHEIFSSSKVEHWGPTIQKERAKFISRLSSNPDDWKGLIQEYVGSFMVYLTYGQDLDTDYTRLVNEVNKHGSCAAQAGRWWINSYPILKYYPQWAPGGNFQCWAKTARELFQEFTSKPFNRVKKQLQDSPNSTLYSFVHKNLTSMTEGDAQMEKIIAGTAASLHSAAVDTITSVVSTFLLLMTHHPNIQEKAYEEIVSVIGENRLPTLDDAAELPYVDALIKELHRYHPTVPVLTRSATNSDEFESCCIPQNAWVLTNIWAITHDENDYHDPFRFNPERFLDKNKSKEEVFLRDPRDFTFGLGRRRCPGAAVGNAAVYLAVSGILSAFTVEPVPGNRPPIKFTKSLISGPIAFQCIFKPRHNGVKDLIDQALQDNMLQIMAPTKTGMNEAWRPGDIQTKLFIWPHPVGMNIQLMFPDSCDPISLYLEFWSETRGDESIHT